MKKVTGHLSPDIDNQSRMKEAGMFVIVAYDIQADRRRVKIEKHLKDYGQRVNYSVFECEVKKELFESFRDKALALMHRKNDRIVFYRLCKTCYDQREYKGWGGPSPIDNYISL